MNQREREEKSMVLTYLELRQIIGFLAVTLPFILYFGGKLIYHVPLQRSLSYYYHTGMGDVLVGVLCAVAFFTYAYKGYTRTDNRLGHICCVSALGVAWVPCTVNPLIEKGMPSVVNCEGIEVFLKMQICPGIAEVPLPKDILSGHIHLIFSGVLFCALIYFSLFLFPKSNKPKAAWSNRKKQRNKIYMACGVVKVTCMILIIIHGQVPVETKKILDGIHSFFWLESIAIIAFGISWLTKGQAILKDEA